MNAPQLLKDLAGGLTLLLNCSGYSGENGAPDDPRAWARKIKEALDAPNDESTKDRKPESR